jgi:hypothetical protein
MSTSEWAAALDAFEARVASQWAALDDPSLEPAPPFAAPAVPGPMPDELVARATELVHRCRALEDTLSAALADARQQLERLDEPTATAGSSPAEPVFFDSRI